MVAGWSIACCESCEKHGVEQLNCKVFQTGESFINFHKVHRRSFYADNVVACTNNSFIRTQIKSKRECARCTQLMCSRSCFCFSLGLRAVHSCSFAIKYRLDRGAWSIAFILLTWVVVVVVGHSGLPALTFEMLIHSSNCGGIVYFNCFIYTRFRGC